MNFAWTAKGSHFGGAAEQSEAERARLFSEKKIPFLYKREGQTLRRNKWKKIM